MTFRFTALDESCQRKKAGGILLQQRKHTIIIYLVPGTNFGKQFPKYKNPRADIRPIISSNIQSIYQPRAGTIACDLSLLVAANTSVSLRTATNIERFGLVVIGISPGSW